MCVCSLGWVDWSIFRFFQGVITLGVGRPTISTIHPFQADASNHLAHPVPGSLLSPGPLLRQWSPGHRGAAVLRAER